MTYECLLLPPEEAEQCPSQCRAEADGKAGSYGQAERAGRVTIGETSEFAAKEFGDRSRDA